VEHTHDDHQNSHSIENESELDPHTWLDPQLVRHHASIITNALTQIDPDFAQQYIANFQKFSADLEQLDQTLKQLLQPFSGQSIYVFHPAFGYFCKAYNLVQKAVAVDGKEPGARHLARLIETARNDKIQAIFVQPQFSSKTASAIAEAIGAKIVPIDPLAQNYISNMMHIAQEIIQSQSQISSTN
jgi:zinc transport system substrate-binding protein